MIGTLSDACELCSCLWHLTPQQCLELAFATAAAFPTLVRSSGNRLDFDQCWMSLTACSLRVPVLTSMPRSPGGGE